MKNAASTATVFTPSSGNPAMVRLILKASIRSGSSGRTSLSLRWNISSKGSGDSAPRNRVIATTRHLVRTGSRYCASTTQPAVMTRMMRKAAMIVI